MTVSSDILYFQFMLKGYLHTYIIVLHNWKKKDKKFLLFVNDVRELMDTFDNKNNSLRPDCQI